jgi:hypothetical protein
MTDQRKRKKTGIRRIGFAGAKAGKSARLLHPHRIGYREFVAATGATGSKHLFSGLATHAGAEAVLVHFLSAGGLECPFHR